MRILVLLSALFACGCSATVGSKAVVKPGNSTVTNGSPNSLTLTKADETWATNNTGPSDYTELVGGGVVTMKHGIVGRKIYYDKETGRFVVDSGADITAEGIEINQQTGKVSIAKFATVGGDQIRAGNEAYDRLVAYWSARDEESRKAIIAELEMIKEVAPTAGGVITSLIETLSGVK
jgi:hypothetical protein